MPPSRFPSEAKLRNSARKHKEGLLTDPAFQKALQNIRAEFHVPYPATPEEHVCWYTQHLGGWNREAFWNAVDDCGPEFQHFVQEVNRYCAALEQKYNIPLTLAWSLKSLFDRAVDDALQRLGLPNSFKEEFVAYLFSDHPWMVPCGMISYSTRQSRVAGLTQYTLSFSSYESEADIDSLLRSHRARRKQGSKALKGRPTQVSDSKTLERLILDAVRANDALPKGQRETREALRTRLWQETREKRLHTLTKSGFKTFFYDTLRPSGLTKEYQQW